MIKYRNRSNKNREGIALIMVVGLLALMMVLGVAFAVYMRTGSVAAGNYRGDVVARQLLPVALNRALSEIERTVGDNMYPPWDVMSSTGTADNAEVTNSAMLSWIPQGVLSKTNQVAPTWIDVGNNSRVAYIVLNCSGLLDANYAGGGGARACGASPSEIQISEMAEVNDASALVNGRTYETIQQLGMVGANASPAPLVAAPSNLVTYSYFPLAYNGETNGPVSLAGSAADLSRRKAAIIQAFNKSVFSGANSTLPAATNLYNELIDYVDVDDVPQNLWSPCTESVPMFNEIQLTLNLAFSSNNVFSAARSTMDIEWAYPFITGVATRKFDITYSLNFKPSVAGFPVITATTPLTSTIDSGYNGSFDPWVAPRVNFGNSNLNYSAFVGQQVTLTGQVVLVMSLHGGAVVDAAPTNSAGTPVTIDIYPMTFTVPASPISPNPDIKIQVVCDYDCTDPRFNWLPSHWRLVKAPTLPSLRSENARTKNYRTGNSHVDSGTNMFVGNHSLQSLAELSYLPQAVDDTTFWQTIRVYPTSVDSVHPVLDYFTLATNSTLKGVVNPNTRSVEVMKALFKDMKVDEYPGGPSSVAPIDVQALANEWVTNGNPVVKLSDLGQKCTNLVTVSPFNGSEFRKESLLRNMVGLLHPRQNYFMILICSQTYKTLPKALGVTQKISGLTAHGVAEVWRDPWLNSSGKHNVYVRMIKTVEE